MFQTRAATSADCDAIAMIDVETWQATYADLLPPRILTGMSPARRALIWQKVITQRPGDTIVISPDNGPIIGFGSCGRQTDPILETAGEIYTLYILPDWQNQGAGRTLMRALFGHLLRTGYVDAALWVLAGNPARFFYEREGGRLVARRTLTLGKNKVPALAYRWPDLASGLMDRANSKRAED